ncbi:hypothetical protein KZ483_00785 [Paenibacillus sp. sptzw28]|uniref:hypothetical protein n=1 Tax=Paenibacillus sp. sptzw28 TaxID=715179 RepID=UPI001C6E1EB2|nr:hypothetical protein [Paenibacillus sp. sptzw28]QYR21631.1 hypothetical protein KZ483_00785 [Paenibacillus sp. sptzw28]
MNFGGINLHFGENHNLTLNIDITCRMIKQASSALSMSLPLHPIVKDLSPEVGMFGDN